jgi:phospholipid-translocating ATPase
LYTFNGKIELANSLERNRLTFSIPPNVDSNTVPLMAENLLLRGSRLKNTEWVIGCAVYTGQSTKLALNSRITSNKTSSSESYINKYLVFFLFLLIVAVTVSYFMKRYYDLHYKGVLVYLGPEKKMSKLSQFIQDYFSFFVLFKYLVPISLYVTIEIHKLFGGFFLEWDQDLYDEEIDQPCIVNTSDLNDDLGQVQLLFSDKTGTLTKNIMIFQQCSINGKRYVQEGNRLQEEGRSYGLKINQCSVSIF